MNQQRQEVLNHLRKAADHLNAAIIHIQNGQEKAPDRSDYSFLVNKLGEMFRETNTALHYTHDMGSIIFQSSFKT